MATYFVWLNRNKQSVTLDTKDPRGRDALEQLLAKADVFVQNLAPGAATRQGLDAHSLVERFPSLVAVNMSGVGDGGPMAQKRAYDLVVQAETGPGSILGTPREPANRSARREEVHGIVRDAMARLSFADAVVALDAAGIANGRLNTPRELLHHPQLAERDRWREVDSPVGPVQALLPVPVVDGWDYPMHPVPDLGEHSRAVLTELGYDAATIDELDRDGAI